MIEVEHLTKYFGPVLAVDDVSFQVEKGAIVGFLGPNGAGKTTTLRILTSYLPASSGIARVAGFDVMTQSMEVRRNVGYLPESVPLYPEMRVEEYLEYRAKLKGVPRATRRQRLEYCLDRCRIREVRRRLAGTLSKGYRQRVGLADAMIHDPPILILDEPTAGLDPLQIRETLALIKQLGQDHTILLSTHILSEVEAVCDRVIIIYGGRIGLAKKMAELESDPTMVLEIRGPQQEVRTVLQQTEGVLTVHAEPLEDGVVLYEVRSARKQDLREKLAQRVLQQGWMLRRLDLQRRRLEDHFMGVIRQEDPLQRLKAVKPDAIQPAPSKAG